MFAVKTSPTKLESSSTSNTDDISPSSQTVNSLHYDFANFQPPKSAAPKDMADQAHAHWDESPSPNQESIEEDCSNNFDPWPKPKSGYTRRLIRMVHIPLDEIDEDFDEDAWNRKVYGPNVEIVDMRNVPKGWVLVHGITPA
jgi:hypothetical protein